MQFVGNIKRTKGKKVLVFSLDSLWSDEELHYLVVNKLLSIDVEIISISEPSYSIYEDNILTDGKSIAEYIQMLTASFTALNLANARANIAKQGKKPCGTIPFGYLRNTCNDIIINDEEAPTLSIIFEVYKQLKSLSKLENYLSLNNYYNRHDRAFQKGTLAKILKNDFYIGYITYDGKKQKGKHRPLIDKDLFYDVQSILARNIKTTKI